MGVLWLTRHSVIRFCKQVKTYFKLTLKSEDNEKVNVD
jgi:hypothetical protein